jgi:hypothetical protein
MVTFSDIEKISQKNNLANYDIEVSLVSKEETQDTIRYLEGIFGTNREKNHTILLEFREEKVGYIKQEDLLQLIQKEDKDFGQRNLIASVDSPDFIKPGDMVIIQMYRCTYPHCKQVFYVTSKDLNHNDPPICEEHGEMELVQME